MVLSIAFIFTSWSLLCLWEGAPSSSGATNSFQSSLVSYKDQQPPTDEMIISTPLRARDSFAPEVKQKEVPRAHNEDSNVRSTGKSQTLSIHQPRMGEANAIPKSKASNVQSTAKSETFSIHPGEANTVSVNFASLLDRASGTKAKKSKNTTTKTVSQSLVDNKKHNDSNTNHSLSTINATNRIIVDDVGEESHYFETEVPLESLIKRGNVLTVHTGCSIATWSYQGKRHKYRPLNDCRQHAKNADALKAHQVTAETAHQVQAYDTIYVPIVKLEHFVNTTLPNITQPFVLLSGQNSKPEDPIPNNVYNTIVKHPRIVKWFLQNLSVYAATDPHHPKLHPFPYGIHPMQSASLLAEISISRNKTTFIYKSWFRKSNNIISRRHIPNGEKVNVKEYLKRMHESEYVLSPDGDRPECHRHYEAIAMGTMPITSLDPVLYRHLARNVVFGENQWNLTVLKKALPRKPVVNQRLIFQEYWIEYVEREAGHALRWWDPSRDVRCSLAEIAAIVRQSSLAK